MNDEVSCDIVKDLMPSYMEKLTREDTTRAVNSHLSECESCREYLELLSTPDSPPPPEKDAGVRFLKKVRRKTLLRVVIGVAAAVAAMCVFAYVFFVNPVPVSGSEMRTGDVYRLSNGRVYWELILEGPSAGVGGMNYGLEAGGGDMQVGLWYTLANKTFRGDGETQRVYHFLSPPEQETSTAYYRDETWDYISPDLVPLWDESDIRHAPPEIEALKDQMTIMWVTPEHKYGTPTATWD